MLSNAISAQTQQGIVKTKGRMDNNGSIIVGSPISDAYVTVLGTQTVSSNKDGKFSVGLKSKEFYLKDVTKEGYVLCDADVISRQYAYSAAPLYIVMETPSQLMEDKLYAERRLRRTLTKQLQEKENEIDSLKKQQRISDEEYRQRLQQIFSDQEENEKLITEMSERYAGIDYDQLDEFNRQISQYILNGELMKADSLIRTKGELTERAEYLKEHQHQNAAEEEKLRKRQKRLEQSKAFVQKELEDVARDCYSMFEIYKMQHKNDSAAYYLELRATLDTTNVEWQLETGDFYSDYLANNIKAEKLYSIALNNANQSQRNLSMVYNCIGSLLMKKGEYKEAIIYHYKALEIQQIITPRNENDIATTYSDLGTAYYYLENLDSADICFKEDALLTMKLYGNNHHKLATTYANMAEVNVERGEYAKAIEYNLRSLEIDRNIEQSDKIQLDIATIYNNIAIVYRKIGEYEKDTSAYTIALQYLFDALDIRKHILGEKHPAVATVYNNLSNVYDSKYDYEKSLKYSLMDINIVEEIYGEDNPDLAISYGNLALTYKRMKNYEQAMIYNQLALQLKLKYYPEISTTVGGTYNNMGTLYYMMGDLNLAHQYLSKAYNIISQIMGEEHKLAKIIKGHIADVEEELKLKNEL